MIEIKKIIIFVIITIGLFSSMVLYSNKLDSNSDIVLKIIPHENIEEDNIIIKIVFINNTKKDINLYNWRFNNSMKSALNIYLFFNIKLKEKVLTYKYEGPIPMIPYKDDFITLLPGERYEETIALNEYYYLKNEKVDNKYNWPKGIYEITCIYKYTYENTKYGRDLWEGELISNTLNISL